MLKKLSKFLFTEASSLRITSRRLFVSPTTKKPENRGIPSFLNYKFISPIEEYLSQKELLTPSPIQQLAFGRLLNPTSKNPTPIFLGGPTGSGKTLAYLLPIIHALKAEEEQNESLARLPGRPRAIILAPSKELIDQIYEIAKEISHTAKLKVEKIDGASNWATKTRYLREGVDVLITNINKFERLTREKRVHLSALRFFVTDEADVFLENGSAREMAKYAKNLYFTSSQSEDPVQMLYVSATLTRPLKIFLETAFDNQVDFLLTRDTHFNLANLQHHFVPVREQNKLELLKSEIEGLRKKTKESFLLVFCNSVAAVRAVDYYLKSQGIDCASLHSDMPIRLRAEAFQNFRAQKTRVMVCSDLAARGLDFTHLTEIVNFDFPKNTNDYLHRAGRAGRIGQPGTVLSLYQNKDLQLIKQLEASYETRLPLEITQSSYALKNKEDLRKNLSQRQKESDFGANLPSEFVDFRKQMEQEYPIRIDGRKKKYADAPDRIKMKKPKNFLRAKIKEVKKGLKKQISLTPGSKRVKYLKRELKRMHKKRLGLISKPRSAKKKVK